MGYAQHVRSPRSGVYYLARYLNAAGRYGTVKDERTGETVHFERKRDAKKAADAAEAAVREGRAKELAKIEVLTFREWASAWYASLQLAASTMISYREHLELHILPGFQDAPMRDGGILAPDVDAWEAQLRTEGYAEGTIKLYRGTFRSCLAAAVRAGILKSNPAAAADTAGRGRRGVARAAATGRAAEKVITTVLGGLLVAERIAILTGRDADFIMSLTLQHAGLRLGECIGLEACYASPGSIRVEWQLAQAGGNLIKAIPKDGSRGDVTVPWFLSDLIAWHTGHVPPAECACHGFAYLFGGPPAARGRGERGGVTIRDVAAAAAVPVSTVWGVMGDAERFAPQVRAAVREAAGDLGWAPGSAPADTAWHWRQAGVERLVTAAASGMWPAEGKRSTERAVPLTGDWPGTALRRPQSARHAEWCWMPVARGLTPHGLRHSLRTWMEESGVPHVLAEAQLRHELAGIDVYRHVTEGMRSDYRAKLDGAWREALQRRGEMAAESPVRVVSALLREASGGRSGGFLARNSQGGTVSRLRARR